jgi:hypothetical protein
MAGLVTYLGRRLTDRQTPVVLEDIPAVIRVR